MEGLVASSPECPTGARGGRGRVHLRLVLRLLDRSCGWSAKSSSAWFRCRRGRLFIRNLPGHRGIVETLFALVVFGSLSPLPLEDLEEFSVASEGSDAAADQLLAFRGG